MDFARDFKVGYGTQHDLPLEELSEAPSAPLAGYMNLTSRENIISLEVDSRKERLGADGAGCLGELMEIFRVSEEAETAQKPSNEKAL